MTISLFLKFDRLEPIYGWLEERPGLVAQLWGWERARRSALLAYADGGSDVFGWGDWASAAREDPSELCTLFDPLELQVDNDTATRLNASFLGVFSTTPPPAAGAA